MFLYYLLSNNRFSELNLFVYILCDKNSVTKQRTQAKIIHIAYSTSLTTIYGECVT